MIGLVTMINKKSDVLPCASARVMTRPKSRLWRVPGAALLLAGLLVTAGADAETLAVGVYENAPKVYQDTHGRPAGLFVELLDEIARQEGFHIRYVPCAWNDCLDQLASGQLDLMPDVAYSPERALRFDFHAIAVANSWSTVMVRDSSPLQALPDLAGKRIAVLHGGVQEPALRRMMEGYNLAFTQITVEKLADGYAAVKDGNADAVVSNSFFAGRFANAYGLRETAIVFNPANLYFATGKGRHAELLKRIDDYLRRWRGNAGSIYFQAMQRAMAPLPVELGLSTWQKSLLFGLAGLTLSLLVLSALLRRQVHRRGREHEAHLAFLANHDSLTGLPNRSLLSDRLGQAIEAAGSAHAGLVVMLLNVDRLHRVNDGFGHEAGDALLRELARRLKSELRTGATLSRIGSDEFAILLNPPSDAEDAAGLASRLLADVARPCEFEQHVLTVTASIGISLYPDDGATVADLLKSADTALTKAKDLGRNRFRFATAQMNAMAQRWVEIEHHLRRALLGDQFFVQYQPRASLSDGSVSSAEALLRWQSPELGLVSPGEFIPVAEDVGLINALGEWVLRAACAQNVAWLQAGLPPIRVAVNVSAHQFVSGGLPQLVRRVLDETTLSPHLLEIELTESVMMHDSENTLRQLAELNAMGVSVSLDDFGTGYSSLGYLSRFALDSLKIDQSFVRNIIDDSKSAAIANATIGLAHGLGIKVIAEGIETQAQLDYLRTAGCDEMQGYYFSRPVSPDALAELLRERRILQFTPATGRST